MSYQYPLHTGIREGSDRYLVLEHMILVRQASTSELMQVLKLTANQVEQAAKHVMWRTSERTWDDSMWWDYKGTERIYLLMKRKFSSGFWAQNEKHPFNWDWCRVGSEEFKLYTK